MTSSLFQAIDQHLSRAIGTRENSDVVAVAVSGGSDSMALCLLANEWCRKHNLRLIGLTVDHGLRDASAIEATKVQGWLSELGIEHHILNWPGPYPTNGIQQAARQARYDLLLEKCRNLNAHYLLLGHQLEDQLETLLMRLSKGSGLQGLAAMELSTRRAGINLIRPLLTVPRANLRSYLEVQRQKWIEDPSNDNPVFTRTKLNQVLASLTSLPGSDLTSVQLASQRLQRADDALEEVTREHLKVKAFVSEFGFVRFPFSFGKDLPAEIGIRFLEKIFIFVRGIDEKPSLSAVEKLLGRLLNDAEFQGATLGGCQLKRFKGQWMVCREPGRDDLPVSKFTDGSSLLWDDRFKITDLKPDNCTGELEVRKTGEEGWRIIKQAELPKEVLSLPAVIRKNLPAIWNNDKIVAAPLFSCESGGMGIAQERFEVVFSPACDFLY